MRSDCSIVRVSTLMRALAKNLDCQPLGPAKSRIISES